MARKTILLMSTLLAVSFAALFVVSITNHPEWVYSTPSKKKEYWLSRGEVGGRWTAQVDKARLRPNVTVIEAHVGDQVFPFYAPTTLLDYRWGGVRVTREEQWFPRPGIAKQWLEISLPLWMPGLAFSMYPIIVLSKRPRRWVTRSASRIGWFRFITLSAAVALIGVAAVFFSLAIFVPDHVIFATFFFVPGAALLSLVWLFRRKADSTSEYINASLNPLMRAVVQSQTRGTQE